LFVFPVYQFYKDFFIFWKFCFLDSITDVSKEEEKTLKTELTNRSSSLLNEPVKEIPQLLLFPSPPPSRGNIVTVKSSSLSRVASLKNVNTLEGGDVILASQEKRNSTAALDQNETQNVLDESNRNEL
jgi:hypothetical protein